MFHARFDANRCASRVRSVGLRAVTSGFPPFGRLAPREVDSGLGSSYRTLLDITLLHPVWTIRCPMAGFLDTG